MEGLSSTFTLVTLIAVMLLVRQGCPSAWEAAPRLQVSAPAGRTLGCGCGAAAGCQTSPAVARQSVEGGVHTGGAGAAAML